jgi:hypothetical protein
MGAEHTERTEPSAADKADAQRWAEISRECHPPHSFAHRLWAGTAKLLGGAAGMALGGVAGAIAFENPFGGLIGGAAGAYDGWEFAARYVDDAEQSDINACTVNTPLG